MDPILRRSSFYYVTSAVMYLALMGRYLVTRDWPVFEVVPLFIPVWLLSAMMVGAALARMDEGVAEPSTLVYLTCICLFSLLAVAGYQIGIWRFGFAAMKPALIVTIVAGILAIIAHLASLKAVHDWPALSQLASVRWLGRAPWISSAVLFALALLADRVMMRFGVRIKAESEAHL